MTGLNWFPGHAVKAKGMLRENIKLVDLVFEILDARIPFSSRNPDLVKICGPVPRLVVLNKKDLADHALTRVWEELIAGEGSPVVAVKGTSRKSLSNLPRVVGGLTEDKLQSIKAKGRRSRSIRCLLVGMPNVGKSSIINTLAGRKVARVEDRPGVTRGKQWIRVRKDLEFLDTPGILPPRVDEPATVIKLIVTGAIKADETDMEKAALWLLEYLAKNNFDFLIQRYKLPKVGNRSAIDLLQEIGRRRGALRTGGKVDFYEAARLLLREYQTGLLGSSTLDTP